MIAAVYDAFLLAAVLFTATFSVLPLNGGRAFTPDQFYYPFYLFYLLVVSFGFYGWFWTHGGQTLGMRAWRIRVLTMDGRPLAWKQALIRFVALLISWGLLGLGFFWGLVDKYSYTWHDYLSRTAVFFDAEK